MSSENLTEILAGLSSKSYVAENPRASAMIRELVEDIQRDFYTVVVLGEFKRGKSTFINALLGTPLLPMDILPETATINAIMYRARPKISVVSENGERVGKPTPEFLKEFSASTANPDELSQIRYIKIGYPVDILKNRIVLVDTPGVADLSAQRAEITRSFIPKANAVIFVLDANSPLTKTEKTFIDDYILPRGITDVLFLLNKFDSVDEEEDADFLSDTRKRIASAFPALKNIECLPVSARDALSGDEKLVAASGINEVRQKLIGMLDESRVELNKQLAYKSRLYAILNAISTELYNARAIKFADVESLRRAAEELNAMLVEEDRYKDNIKNYAATIRQEIFKMADKSIDYFHRKLTDDLRADIDAYNSDNFKNFIEFTVTKNIRNRYENWLATNISAVNHLLKLMESEIARGLSLHFKQNIKLSSRSTGSFNSHSLELNISAEDISGVNVKVGIAVFGLMTVLAHILNPFIGLAAVPFLRKKFLNSALAEAKANVLPEIEKSLDEATGNLKSELHRYIDARSESTVANAEAFYENILGEMHARIQAEIDAKNSANFDAQSEADKITRELEDIVKLGNEI